MNAEMMSEEEWRQELYMFVEFMSSCGLDMRLRPKQNDIPFGDFVDEITEVTWWGWRTRALITKYQSKGFEFSH